MSIFEPPSKPTGPLGLHRVLSPTAGLKISPIALGGISLGHEWSEVFGKNEDPFCLMDAYFDLGGNFIDTANVYNSEESERLIGDWMLKRGVRDQMVIATKYSAHYKAYDRKNLPLQSNYTGNSAKTMHISIRDSLAKLKTDYIDILYVHWWDFGTSVEEVMRHLHSYVMARQVLYLGISDTPAWIVVKANSYAKAHGLTPFSVYQGKWNVSFRDMEAEIIPMCEDQGLGIVPWAAIGGGNLLTKEQRDKVEADQDGRKPRLVNEKTLHISQVLESMAHKKGTTLQAVALAYLFQQSTYVFPIVGVQTVEHVKALSEALNITLSEEEIHEIYQESKFEPLFPMGMLFTFRGNKDYNLSLTTATHNQQTQMSAWIEAPRKQMSYRG